MDGLRTWQGSASGQKVEIQKVKPDYHVVSFSGGKDSTAMLLRMLELGMQVDEILFCDMTVEFPDLWNKLMWWQTQTWSAFVHKTKVKKLEVRFAYEDEIGATPRTKEFFAEVERRYRHPKKHERIKVCTQPS